MARKRIIDPEFWSDEEIGHWSFPARLFYIGLWNFADDEGRLKANIMLLKSEVFPYDKRINMSKLKQEVASKVIWYEVNGSQYGFIKNFLKHQRIDRPSISKISPPPQFDEGSANNRGVVPPNIIEVNISKDKRSALSFPFEEIWSKYPKRVGKKEAERHFKASVKTEGDWKDIQTALKNYLESDRVVRKGYIQDAKTFFNNWQDWKDYKEPICPKCRNTGKYISTTGYEIVCDCPKGQAIKIPEQVE